jgi:hypothetical protein
MGALRIKKSGEKTSMGQGLFYKKSMARGPHLLKKKKTAIFYFYYIS